MHLVNRYKSTANWAAYITVDNTNTWELFKGELHPDGETNVGMGQHAVRLRVNGKLYQGPFVNTTKVLINAQAVPVSLTGEIAKYLGLFGQSDSADRKASTKAGVE